MVCENGRNCTENPGTGNAPSPHSPPIDGFAPVRVSSRLGFFLVDFEVEDDFLLAVEAGDGTGWGLGAVFFRVDFVVGVGIEAAEAIVALIIGDVAADRVAAHIFEADDGGRNRGGVFVQVATVNGVERRFAFGVWGSRGLRCEKQQRKADSDEPRSSGHFFPPAGSIRKTTLFSLKPLLASIVRA